MILDKLRKNPIDKIKLSELKEEEIRLKNQIERVRKEIFKIEKEKKKKFEEGIGADLMKKKIIAAEIRQLDMEAKLKMRIFRTLYKKYTFVINLITIKKYEKLLKNSPIWDKICNLSPEQLETILIRVNLKGKEFDEVLDVLNRVFEMDIAEFETVEDEEEKQLFEAWSAVEAGKMDVEEVEKMLSVEKNMER